MDRTGDERIETGDPLDDPPKPTPQIETDVEIGGGGVLIPDDEDEVKPDERETGARRAATRTSKDDRSARASDNPHTIQRNWALHEHFIGSRKNVRMGHGDKPLVITDAATG